MKKLSYLIVLALILGLVLTGCTLLSNIGQTPTSEQSGITYLTKSPGSLVGLWHFDETSGTTATDSSGANDGTLTNMNTPDCWDSGMFGNALSFDGENDYVSVGDIGVTGDWTVEFWANLACIEKVIYYPIGLSLPTTYTYGPGIFIAFTDGRWGFYDGNPTSDVVWGSAVSIDTWYHFAVTKSGITYSLYLDGNLESSGDFTDVDVTDLNIGKRSDHYPAYFEGLIDEVRIWNTTTPSFNLDVEPKLDFNPVGTDHTVTATVTIGGTEPAPGVLVDFTVSGINDNTKRVLTDSNGQATFTYNSSEAGKDTITAEIKEAPYAYVSDVVTKYWLEPFVTGGGNIKNGKKTIWTFGGNVGLLGDGNVEVVGQFQIVDHVNKIAYHCNDDFTSLFFSGGEAESPFAHWDIAIFTGTFTNNKNADPVDLTIIIEDKGEPGAGTDTISVTGFTTLSTNFSDTINGGNFQVHDL